MSEVSEEVSIASASTQQPLTSPRLSLNHGGVKLLGCRLRLASDDFVLPAWIAFLARCGFLVATAAIMSYSMQIVKTGQSCINLHSLDIYMPIELGLIATNAAFCLLLACHSAKGVIWDDNPKSRRWVAPILHASLFLGIGEIVMITMGTIWISKALKSDCAKTPSEQTSMYVILGLIVGQWIGILITVIIILLSMKDLWPICCCRSRSKGKRGEFSHPLSHENATRWLMDHVTDPGECCFLFFKRCCVATKQVDYFNDVADLINDIFVDDAFVPTDIAAALILLSTQSEVQPTQEVLRGMKNKALHIKDLPDYIAYGFASYGCAMYLYDNEDRLKHCSDLCSQASVCACCCCFPWSMHNRLEYIEGDNCCLCHLATVKLKLPHVSEDDIIHMSLLNNFLETPFLMVADRKLNKLVISIRGALSLADLMTDMVAKPASLKALLLQSNLELSNAELNSVNSLPDDIEVHLGMAEAAIYVFKQLRQKHLLEQAHVHYPDYPIVVTGHSLGAGTAVILAFILRLKFPNIKCYAFGPPGALLNSPASKMSMSFVTSVIVGDDLIPRLSVNAYSKLRAKMKKALIACRLPKHTVLALGLCNCLSPITWKDRLKHDPSILNSNDLSPLSGYGSAPDDIERGQDTYDLAWSPMLPPGKIIHVKELSDGELTMCFREPAEFNEILVSTKMINDHTPSTYQRVLTKIADKYRA